MIPQGTDIWLKATVVFVAVDFILSLPSWALGLVLVLTLAASHGLRKLRQKEPQGEEPPSSPAEGSDVR